MGKLRAAEDSPEWLRDLFEALREDDEDVVERIVKEYECVNEAVFSTKFDAYGNSGDLGSSQLQIDNSCTPLHVACHHGSRKVAKLLIRLGADCRQRDGLFRLPLELTSSKAIRKMLLKRMPKALRGAAQGVRRSNASSSTVSRSLDSGKVLREVDYKIDEIKGHISTDVLEMRRDIDGLAKDLMLLEGRLQRSLVKKAQYIYANLQDKFGGIVKKEDGEDDGSPSDGSGLAESILATQGVKRNEKRLIAMGQRMKELEARDKKREESIKALDSELDDLRDAIKDVLVVEKHKTVRQLRADVDALQRKIKFMDDERRAMQAAQRGCLPF